MITYTWKSKSGEEHAAIKDRTHEEFHNFLHEHKSEIAYIAAEVDGKFWTFDLQVGWKEHEHDPEDLPF